VKCLVQNIVVDISVNQIGGLCTLCFLEKVIFQMLLGPFCCLSLNLRSGTLSNIKASYLILPLDVGLMRITASFRVTYA
jgi:hypothetical protein